MNGYTIDDAYALARQMSATFIGVNRKAHLMRVVERLRVSGSPEDISRFVTLLRYGDGRFEYKAVDAACRAVGAPFIPPRTKE